MELKPKKIIDNIYLVRRLRKVLLFQLVISIPLLAASIFMEYIIQRYARNLNLNPEFLFYPLVIIIGAAILTTPLLFYVLLKEKRIAWIMTFFYNGCITLFISFSYC